MPLIFLANKVDLTENTIPVDINGHLEDIVNKYHGQFFPTSAKTGMNVEDVFQLMGRNLTKKFFE